jgi:hypothetical protein
MYRRHFKHTQPAQIAADVMEELGEVEAKLARLPADWRFEIEDDVTWFPLTAQELNRAKAERDALREENEMMRCEIEDDADNVRTVAREIRLEDETTIAQLQAQNRELRDALKPILSLKRYPHMLASSGKVRSGTSITINVPRNLLQNADAALAHTQPNAPPTNPGENPCPPTQSSK